MRKPYRTAVVAAAVPILAAACSDYLSGPKLSVDPNRPTNASANQLFTGVQVATFALFETTPAMVVSVWSQQSAGVARQWQNFADYTFTEYDADGIFSQTYGGGGLTDIRRIQKQARAENNQKFLGIAQVYEALVVGQAADWFGDIPYSQALTSGKPTLDPQAEVYASIQAVLDSAISNLAGSGIGPTSIDFVYGNNAGKWTRLAHTLKARYYLHMSRGADSIAMFTKARDEALLGISSSADDFTTVHGTSDVEANLWYQFLYISRAGDIDPGATLIDLLKARGDNALLAQYFNPNESGNYVGSVDRPAAAGASTFNLGKDSPIRVVTYAENQMILAETQYRLGNTGAALTTLNAFRATIGEAPVVAAGAQLLVQILQEKYVTNFLSPEVYQDYLRTCYPNLPLTPGAKTTYIPARFYYGYTERISNENIPATSEQPKANPNFPKNLTDPLGNVCLGQVNRPGT